MPSSFLLILVASDCLCLQVPGSFEGAVKINRQHVVHSPVALAFVSTAFMIEHTEVRNLTEGCLPPPSAFHTALSAGLFFC